MSGMEILGVSEIQKVLKDFAPKHANNLMRSTVHAVAAEITKESKKRVPTNTGNLKRSLKTKRRRGKPGQPVSDVIADSGPNARHDGFYWRFVEFGTRNTAERPFMRTAKQIVFSSIDRIIKEKFKDKLTKAVAREKKRRQKR